MGFQRHRLRRLWSPDGLFLREQHGNPPYQPEPRRSDQPVRTVVLCSTGPRYQRAARCWVLPDAVGGYFQTGHIHAVDKGDVNNDTTDFFALSHGPLSSGNTTARRHHRSGIPASLATVSLASRSAWVPTCTNADADGGRRQRGQRRRGGACASRRPIHHSPVLAASCHGSTSPTRPASSTSPSATSPATDSMKMVSIRTGGKVRLTRQPNQHLHESRYATVQLSGSTNAGL